MFRGEAIEFAIAPLFDGGRVKGRGTQKTALNNGAVGVSGLTVTHGAINVVAFLTSFYKGLIHGDACRKGVVILGRDGFRFGGIQSWRAVRFACVKMAVFPKEIFALGNHTDLEGARSSAIGKKVVALLGLDLGLEGHVLITPCQGQGAKQTCPQQDAAHVGFPGAH